MNWWRLGFSLGKSVSECFTNKCLCEVWEIDFWEVETWISVDYDRGKCQERVGENGTEIHLTVWFLREKWWNRKWKNGKPVLSAEHGRAWFSTGRANLLFPCVLAGLRFSRFLYFFTHFCFELAFDVNMKVVDNWVSFLMALVGLENDF